MSYRRTAPLAHKCQECPMTFPSKKGLDNHVKANKRTATQPTAAQAARTAPTATPTGRLRTTTSQTGAAAPARAMSTRMTRRSTPANPNRRPPQCCKPGQHRSEHDESQHLRTYKDAACLRKCENTAPGGDRITYRHWQDTDPDAPFLSAAFNMCLRFKRVPPAWKETRTILVHKKGDLSEVTNWRPIALGSTISKLYAGCLVARMQQLVCDHDVLSRCQKGFLPHDGVFEHNFVLQECLDAARAGGGDLCVAFFDFTNAFRSVPHNALIDSLRGAEKTYVSRDINERLYNGIAYIISKLTYSLPTAAAIAAAYVFPAYSTTGLPQCEETRNFGPYMGYTLLYLLTVRAVAMTLAWTFPTQQRAAAFLGLVVLVFCMSGGYAVHLMDLSLVTSWLQWVSPLRWTLEQLTMVEFAGGMTPTYDCRVVRWSFRRTASR
ncbi:hypothetical protein MTO96_031655 [Rhipicephalus appendiculatus]